MIKVGNKKAVRRLALRSFGAAKTRNSIAMVAIALTTILFTSLFTIGSGMLESMQRETLRQAGGDGHILLKYLTPQQYENIKDHPLIDRISYNQIVCDSVDNPEFLKRHVEMYCMDETGMELGFCRPTTGRAAQAADEVVCDTKTLDLLGVPHEVGAQVPLAYTIRGRPFTTVFTLSGFYESDPVFNVGFALVSQAFTQQHADLLGATYHEDHVMTGSINSYVMMRSTWDLEGKLDRIVEESGYRRGDGKTDGLDVVDCNTNWAYLSAGSTADPGTVAAVAVGLLLIMLTGYLIIYNIFQISVIRDIRFYGLLKTIGTTAVQIKRIITIQALMLAAVGVPAGLLLGFLLGRATLPLITAYTSFASSVAVTANPWIFLGAAAFSLLTLFISTRKPGRLAARVSPVEAVRFSGVEQGRKRGAKQTTDGGRLPRMALSNLGRSKKRTLLSILSMTLSLVLLNSVFTISQGFDMDKFLSKFVDTDFVAAHAMYFRYQYGSMEENTVSQQLVEQIGRQPGFLEGGRIYDSQRAGVEYAIPEGERYNLYDAAGNPRADIYGMEDFPLSRQQVVAGESDRAALVEKMKTGRYIIESIGVDDNGQLVDETRHFNVGDTVTVLTDKGTFTYEVLAQIAEQYWPYTSRNGADFRMILPAEEYKRILDPQLCMSYVFNVQPGTQAAMDQFLRDYTENVEPTMMYESKMSRTAEFDSTRGMVNTVGGALSAIIGLIGLLNFINSILTSITARRHEFAMLQSIGMTKRQQRRMVCLEGLYYALGTALLALALSTLVSFTVVKGVVGSIWFFTYHFVIWPVAAAVPLLLVLALVIPALAFHSTDRESVVERLRQE